MKIDKLTKDELELEIKRAKFWIEKNSIESSINLIKKMEARYLKLTFK